MPSKKFLKTAAISAIINAFLFFAYSLINLVMLAVQQNVISSSGNNLISFIVNNLGAVLLSVQLLLFLTAFLIYFAFANLSVNLKRYSLAYSAYFSILCFFVFFLIILNSIYSPHVLGFLSGIDLSQADALVGLSFLIFGVLIFTIRKSSGENIIIPLGILYILQGISLMASLNAPVRLVDFTIAIRILECVLFFIIARNLKDKNK